MATRTVKKPNQHQNGLKGKVKKLSYHHSVKINLGHNSYSTIEMGVGMEVAPEESDDPSLVMKRLIEAVHQELKIVSKQQKEVWMKELKIGPHKPPSPSRSKR